MLNFTIDQLVQIVANGGGIEIDAIHVQPDQIAEFAATAARSNARIVVKNASRLTQSDLLLIAEKGNGNVFFEAGSLFTPFHLRTNRS
jgi:hypothetical protein